jgi:hypothetical protein
MGSSERFAPDSCLTDPYPLPVIFFGDLSERMRVEHRNRRRILMVVLVLIIILLLSLSFLANLLI